MSQEDIHEVERLERDALERHEAQTQEPTWQELTEGYIQDLDTRTKSLEERLSNLEKRLNEYIHD